MPTYTILVSVNAPDQNAAFFFVESAVERKLVTNRRIPGAVPEPGTDVYVKTQDGTRSTAL